MFFQSIELLDRSGHRTSDKLGAANTRHKKPDGSTPEKWLKARGHDVKGALFTDMELYDMAKGDARVAGERGVLCWLSDRLDAKAFL